jgi:hypothetical protein
MIQRSIDRFSGQLSTILSTVRRQEQKLGPSAHGLVAPRARLWQAVDPIFRAGGRPAVRPKGVADYVTTVDVSREQVEQALWPKYHRNFLSTKKYRWRKAGDTFERDWAIGSWVYDPEETDTQHHVYLFESPDGGIDLYAHREASVRNPGEHTTGRQTHGDPDGRARARLEDASLDYTEREFSTPDKSHSFKPMAKSKTKNAILPIASTFVAGGVMTVARGSPYAGGAVTALGIILFGAYDILDDRMKGEPQLPDGIDEEMLRAFAETAGSEVGDYVEGQSSK